MHGRHRALVRRPWWRAALASRRRGLTRSHAVRDDSPGTSATVLLAAAGLAGVLVGSTLHAAPGTAVMAASALVPSALLGGALVRARTALSHERWLRRRHAGEVTVSDLQVRRLADRVGLLCEQQADDAAELERTRRQLRRARVEVATSRTALAGVREQLCRARAAADVLAAERGAARARAERAERALAEEVAAARSAVEADVARRRGALPAATRAAVLAAGGAADDHGRGRAGADDAWRPVPRVAGQRSFASVDLRVFDAFTEASLEEEDAVLEAPVRRGRHAAGPALDPAGAHDRHATTVPAAVTVPPAVTVPAARAADGDRVVA